MKGITIISYLPEEFLPVLLAGAGLAMAVGAKKTAVALLTFVLVSALLPTVLAPVLDILPLWAVVVLGIVVVGASIHELMALAMGRERATKTMAKTIGRVVKGILLLPFRILRTMFGGLWAGK